MSKTKKEIQDTLRTNADAVEIPVDINEDIISNFNQQIHFLKQERDTLNSLWKVSQQTINRLEEEVKNYRSQLGFQPKTLENIKGKYENALNGLQASVKSQKKELVKQFKINCEMVAEGHRAQNQIKELKDKLKDMESKPEEVDTAKKEMEDLKVRNAELEKMLKKAHRIIDERMCSEQEALEKVQEVLLISESAVNEKNLALSREQICKEECKNFASIIGEVMDDAAKKVEDNYKDLQGKYKCEIDKLLKENKRLKMEIDESRNSARKAEMNCSKIGSKCAEIMKVNAMLETNLELSSKAIVELEMKIKAYDKLIQRDMRNEEWVSLAYIIYPYVLLLQTSASTGEGNGKICFRKSQS